MPENGDLEWKHRYNLSIVIIQVNTGIMKMLSVFRTCNSQNECGIYMITRAR